MVSFIEDTEWFNSTLVLSKVDWRFYYSKTKIDLSTFVQTLIKILSSTAEIQYRIEGTFVQLRGIPHDTRKSLWYLFIYGGDIVVSSVASIIDGDGGKVWEKLHVYPFKVDFSSQYMLLIMDSFAKDFSGIVQISFEVASQTSYLDMFEVEVNIADLRKRNSKEPFSVELFGELRKNLGLNRSLDIKSIRVPGELFMTSNYIRFTNICSKYGSSNVTPLIRKLMC
ncbi:uncharacterized protein Ecym_3469 [Eremothecium cymbalariae DBVPG|uniref:Uncharacterized protein n=1 Tax=Eremothecium cymbalariae (strain CBS 270.75 / DBVPG 7215 / KCTC 17166 / NRRL Y-17582) TaxID=931890 RepID=G8JS33_ERECY|nr:Hypothetical protein Ecym_3469 [Eremothecium cymbalariae DBVPG\